MINIPRKCQRGRTDCIALAVIASDDGSSFFCCGENDGTRPIRQDRYTTCFKGPHRDTTSYHDKRDLTHGAAVLVQALAVIERDVSEERDWSPWGTLAATKDPQPRPPQSADAPKRRSICEGASCSARDERSTGA
jgi:hypothetical protein